MPNLPISGLPLATSGQPESLMVIVNYDVDPSGTTNKIYFSALTEQFSGATGSSGTSGTSGADGKSSSLFVYSANTSITTGDPGAGHILWNNTIQTGSTQLNISHLTAFDDDIDVYLSLLVAGQVIILQDKNVAENYQSWLVTSNATFVFPDYWTVPVSRIGSNGQGSTNFDNDHELALILVSADGTSGTSGTSGLDGSSGSSGLGVVAGFMRGYKSNTQTIPPATDQNVIFDTIENYFGGDISLNTSTGVITLQGDKTYRLRGTIGNCRYNLSENATVKYQWYDITNSSYLGTSSSSRVLYTSTPDEMPNYGTTEAIFTTTATTNIQLLTYDNTSGGGRNLVIGSTSTGYGSSWFDIEVIGGNAPVTNGTSGTSGSNGTDGSSGTSGTSGSNGTDGSSGTSGTSGSNGTDGSSGTSGSNGTDGSSGTSGLDGSSGTSGIDGSSGTSGTDGSSGTSGTSGVTPSIPSRAWGSFYSIQNQYVTSTTTAYSMTAETVASSSGVIVSADTRFVVASAGTYNLQFSAQLESTGGGNTQIMDIWLAINGNNVSNSNTQVVGNSNNGRNVSSWNFVEPLNAGDYMELKFSVSDIRLGFTYDPGPFTNPTRPAIPSVIVTVTQV